MVEQILPGLYRIEVPIPRNPLKATNSYVIKGGERTLIIDTGMNREECRRAMSAGLKELDVALEKADFFITHLHADHLGLVSSLAGRDSRIYFNRVDAEVINQGGDWGKHGDFAFVNGFPENERWSAIANHPGRRYSAEAPVDFYILKEGDTLDIGDYSLRCVETPGHTGGHTCLYEPEKRLFFSGDHILVDITPNISLWSEDGNPLLEYLSSLEKILDLDVGLVLPGHRRRFGSYRERITELKKHHDARANEVLAILEKGEQNVFRIAAQMTWDMSYECWELFPVVQKWFAFGEAMAHVRYLEQKGMIKAGRQGQEIVFSLP